MVSQRRGWWLHKEGIRCALVAIGRLEFFRRESEYTDGENYAGQELNVKFVVEELLEAVVARRLWPATMRTSGPGGVLRYVSRRRAPGYQQWHVLKRSAGNLPKRIISSTW